MSRFLYIAQVVKTSDDESKFGRINVKLLAYDGKAPVIKKVPYLFQGASKQSGTFWAPDPGDYVVVAPMHGPDEWVALGSIYTSQNSGNSERDAKNSIRELLSPAGSSIKFDDKKGGEAITIKTKAGCEILISQAKGKEIISLKSKKDVKIVAGGAGKLLIQTGADTTIDAKGKVTVTAKAGVLIKGTPSVKVEGQMLTIKGSKIDIKGDLLNLEGQMVTLKGQMVTIKGQMIKLGK